MIREWIVRRRDRRTAEMLARRIPLVLGRFGELIEKYPASFVDEKWLPLDKAGMKTVFKIAIAAEKDPERIEQLRVGWMFLASFQPNIGDTPITFPQASTPEEILEPEKMALLESYVAMSRIVTEESARTLAEIREYVASLSAKSADY
jgi:hypothetical protein